MMRRTLVTAAAATLLVAGVAACGNSSDEPGPLGPPTPSGATEIPGGPMEQLPVPADPKVPTSQQEAQDTVLRYMQQTIDALPEGFSLDGTRYMVGDGTTYCEDEPADRNAPVKLEDWRDMKVPPDTDIKALIAQVGGIWEGWGWEVLERDGFTKPNRFGYAPDGYVLHIEARPDPTQAPSLIGSSPCFPGDLRQDDVERPPVLNQSG
ncbi:hypothetical protein A5633_17710 [Mycolicibacterium elephantis]|uniref:hypothetical protein n=1 Tax=Mycolicibacterium elephantis TaxID=81858 RepID=UPI0007EAE099|nr:hypothetical protein [Mycolicibacterium elephantis]OBA78416.1 hypothetical protein A5633_17710 [Mycolicibacterium elephantis]